MPIMVTQDQPFDSREATGYFTRIIPMGPPLSFPSVTLTSACELNFTPPDNTTWAILAYCNVANGANEENICTAQLARTTGTPTVFGTLAIWKPGAYSSMPMADTPCTFLGIDTFGVSPGQQTYQIQAASSAGGTTLDGLTIVAIPLTSQDYYVGSANSTGTTLPDAMTRSTTSSTTYVTKTALTFTPAAGDYLILSSALLDSTSDEHAMSATLLIDGVSEFTAHIGALYTSPWQAFRLHHFTNESHTISVGYKTTDGSAEVGIGSTPILALKASTFNGLYGVSRDGTYTSPENGTVITTNIHPTIRRDGPHLLLASSSVSAGSWHQVGTNTDIDGDTMSRVVQVTSTSTDRLPYAMAAIRELTTGALHASNVMDVVNSWYSVSGDTPSLFILDLFGHTTDVEPTVETLPVVSAGTTATLNGTITSTGGPVISVEGFVYGTTSVPVNPGDIAPGSSGYTNEVSSSGTFGVNEFDEDITGLTEGVAYYVRAYAGNSEGYAYGDEILFGPSIPTVITGSAVVTGLEATLNGTVTDTGGGAVTAEGFVYGAASIEDDPGNVAPGSSGYDDFIGSTGTFGTGNFSEDITGLTSGNYYYFRAYAQSIAGYAYGDEGYLRAASPPSVSTISGTSAGLLTGNITNTNGSVVTSRGFVYSTSSVGVNPGNVAPGVSGYDDFVGSTGTFGTGTFTDKMLGLEPNTEYYFRAYAQNAGGYRYGAEYSLWTDGIVWRQGTYNSATDGQINSLAFSNNAVNDGLFVVSVTWYNPNNSEGGPAPVVSDSLGNTYSLIQSFYDTDFSQGWAMYYSLNTHGSGPNEIYASYNDEFGIPDPGITYTGLIIDEFYGAPATLSLDDSSYVFNSNSEYTPYTDDVTTTSECNLIYSLYGVTNPPSPIVAGTEFTIDTISSEWWADSNIYAGTQHRVTYEAGEVPITWEASNYPYSAIVIGAAFKTGSDDPDPPNSCNLFGWL